MTDGDDDLDLLEERTEALWDAKIVAMISQSESSQKNVELDEGGPSSYDEDDRHSITSLDIDRTTSESGEHEIIESEILIPPNPNQGETKTTSDNVHAITEKQAKWSFDDLYSIGIGSKPDVVTTTDCGKVFPTQSGHRPQDYVLQSEPGTVLLPDVVNSRQNPAVGQVNQQQSPDVPKVIVFTEDDEQLDDYVDSDSSLAEEITSSPEKTFVSDSRLKRTYGYDKSSSSQSRDSDDDLISSSPFECSSSSSDRPKITARRRFSSKRSFHTKVINISDDSSSPQKMFCKNPDTKKTKKPSVLEEEPPLKVTKSQNECARGDLGLCAERNLHTERIPNHRSEEILKAIGTKCTVSRLRKDSKSTIKLTKSGTEKTVSITSQESQPRGIIISRPEKDQSALTADQSIAKKKDIDKVCEWFPDACRKWIKLKIEVTLQQGNEQFLDHIVDGMVDGNYPKSTPQNDPDFRQDEEPDIVAALGSNKINTPVQSTGRQNVTDSKPAVRLYGKKANYMGGAKGKGKSVVPRKPVRNILDEYQSSEDEKDICMDAAESMETVRDNEVSSSSLTCESCKMNRNTDMVVQCCDGHLICNSCVEKEVKEILSPDSQETQIKCPSENCQSKVPESQAKKILPKLILELLEEKLHKQAVESIIKMEDLVTCPNCSFPVVMDAGIKKFECPNCKNSSCRYCKRLWVMTSHDDCNQFTTFLQENLDSKDLEPPSYWHPMPEEGDKDYAIVTLDEKCVEFQHIKTLFSLSMSASQITAVRRIQNPRLWQKFCLSRKHMVEDFGQNQLNEKQLFHGTSTKAFDAICREGLDWRMCGENGTAFGQGTYFAKQASYSDRYNQMTPGYMGVRSLPPGNSSAAFAQAFNLPSSFNTPPNNAPNPFLASFNFSNMHKPQPQQQQQQNVFKTTSHAFPYVPLSGTSNSNAAGTFSNNFFPSSSNNGAAMFGPFGPSNNSGQPVFAPANIGQSNTNNSLAIFQGHSQGQIMPANVSNPDVSSTTDKIIFTNVEDTIGPNKKYMFVARALVGRCCSGNSGIRKPPSDPGDPKRRPFNSCVDNVLTPSIFVIFDCAQCYPEYIVEYTHR
ncbi:uncharacterized protein LOC110461949 [Mizuhopecten yessoensis]|uniref:Poly [ADP-ribose] polymerase n=1 Tax=Mizuhopecten yessoensis TaxID=6573 RepID=A0A210PZ62_MIZYE|nr:uncharacterized protein LOC110461949 [Mizuhopecten yessoensis]OWF41787.1 Poly [ADP-ribose] polymerase 11 [Mizuhopecten yessoensis]